jgi:hypothetical protein
LRPDFDHAREASLRSIVRSALYLARNANDRNRPPLNDNIGGLVLRAPTAPLKTSDATALTQTALHFVASLQPTSAAAEVFARSLQVSLDGYGQVNVPGITVPLSAWIGEAAPIAVQQATKSTGAVLTPFKLGMILTLTGELYRSSNAENVFRQTLVESAGATLDSVFFSSNAGVADQQPPGILNGISALTATAAGAGAMSGDLGQIATALAPVAGAGPPVIVASPAQAMAIDVAAVRPGTVYASNALPAKTVIGLIPQAIATSIEAPRIELAASGSLVMNTTPTEVVTSPGVVGAPQRSLYQTDTVAIRLVWSVTWARRSNSAVAWIQNVNW